MSRVGLGLGGHYRKLGLASHLVWPKDGHYLKFKSHIKAQLRKGFKVSLSLATDGHDDVEKI